MRKKSSVSPGLYALVLRFTARLWFQHPRRVLSIIACALLATLAEVFTPVFAGRIVSALSRAPAGGVTGPVAATPAASHAAAGHDALTALACLIAAGVIALILRQLVLMHIVPLTKDMMIHVARRTFHRVQRFSTDWHANTFSGSTVRKITRGMWALDAMNDILLVTLLPSALMLIGATLMLGYRWPGMGVMVGVGAVIYVAVAVMLSIRCVTPAARLSNACDTRLGGALADAIGCNAVVKAYGGEVQEEGRLDRVLAKWRKRVGRTWRRLTRSAGVQGAMLLAMQASVLCLALWFWYQGRADAGDLTFVLTMFFVLQGHLRDVGMYIRALQRSVSDMEEMVTLGNLPPGVADRPHATPARITHGDIDFDRVHFAYDGQAPIYRDFSVRIPGGERVGLVGRSGSGKTTFIKLIQRLYDVDQGAIRIDGQDIAEVRQASLRSRIAIVQQEPILFHRSLAENIAYARPGAGQAEVERAARLANADAFIQRLPKGYDTLVGERGVKLSGGERQRVALARAFLADAPILILDEATSSLDSESEHLIQEAMERLMEGRTTLVIAHRLSTVKSLDRLMVFDQGRIVEEGTHRQLVQLEGGIYRGLFERQALDLVKGRDDVSE